MKVDVIEQFIAGKKPQQETCEDALVITEHFIAIVDGATSKAPRRPDSITPGRLIAQTLAKAILDLNPSTTARAAIDELTAVAKVLNDRQAQANEERASARVILLSCARKEVWRLGDCLLRIDGKEYLPKNDLEQSVAAVRAGYNHILLRSGATIAELQQRDLGRELVLPLLKTHNVLANLPDESRFSFGVLNGVPIPDRYIDIIALPSGSYDVVLCSDGYPRAHASLEEAEARLKAALDADPLCISEIIATKGKSLGDASYDDRAYVRLRCDLAR
jgi:glycerophosphoryl diester phosphodiesterase